jgi:uncharacterized protein YggE
MLATALYLLASANAAEPEPTPRNTLDVSGVGEVYVAPDEAVLTLGVRAEADTAGGAFDAAATEMQAIKTALTGGAAPLVPAERIRTSQLSLQPRYSYNEKTGPKLIGYEASSILEIRVDDPLDTGAVIDAAVGAGANEVVGVNWKIEDEAAVRQEALDAAVADARSNAEQVANQLGVTIVEPARVSIRTQDSGPGPMYLERAEAMDADVAGMPVSAGEQIYRAQVDVTFVIAGEGAASEPGASEPAEPET